MTQSFILQQSDPQMNQTNKNGMGQSKPCWAYVVHNSYFFDVIDGVLVSGIVSFATASRQDSTFSDTRRN